MAAPTAAVSTTAAGDVGEGRGGLGTPAQVAALGVLCGVLFLTFLDNTIVGAIR